MLEKLDFMEKRYEELNRAISDPQVISNQDEWKALVKEHSSLQDIVLCYREYKKLLKDLDEVKEMLEDNPDTELKELLDQELNDLNEKREELVQKLKLMLIPKDPND